MSTQVALTEHQVDELCALYGEMQQIGGPEYEALNRFLDERTLGNLRELMEAAAETGEWYDRLDAILEWNEGGPSVPDSWRTVSRYGMHKAIHAILIDPAEYEDVLRWMESTTPAASAAGRDCQNMLSKASELIDVCQKMPLLDRNRLARIVLNACAERMRAQPES